MEQYILSILVGIFIGGAAGYLGTLMLSKRMALVAGPLGHLTLPGIALAMIYGFDISLGAFPFVILGIVIIWLFEMRTKLPMEALTAIVFASGVGVAFLFLPIEEAEAALIGDITQLNRWDAIIAIVLCSGLFILIKKVYSQLTLINVSEDLAMAEGVNVRKYNLIYLGAIALIVALGVKLVGGILTAALVAIPAATAKNISRSLSQFSYISLLAGAFSACLGILLAYATGLPAGPLIIIVSGVLFLLSLVFVRR